jgi:quinol monooxygenase YgiN
MFARSTTIRGKRESLDAGIAMVRDQVWPAVQQLDGCLGLSMLVDRETGGAIVTSAWADADALRASEPQVGPMRDRASQVFGDLPEVRVWEIAVLHRVRPVPACACARVTWTRGDPGTVDDMLEQFRVSVLPQVEDLPGFCSTSLLIDRESGRSVLATTYETREAMEESRAAAMDLRVDATQRMAAEILDVAEFEVVLAHLRVPETV